METEPYMKEVYFHQYCHDCKYWDEPEDSEEGHCDECLAWAFNFNSHKPVNFIHK